MAEPLAYHNGQFVPLHYVGIGLNDLGFLWGATVVDLVRTYRGRWDRLSQHVERFLRSSHEAKVPILKSAAELEQIAWALAGHNLPLLPPGGELCLVMLATPGEVSRHGTASLAQPAAEPTLILHTFPLSFDRYAECITKGATLRIAKQPHLPRGHGLRMVKHRSRLFWWLAEQEVKAIDPNAQAILLDEEGHLTETASANLVLVIDGQLCTPPPGHVLPGVSLQHLKEIAGQAGLPWMERSLWPDDLPHVTEAMATSTPYGLAPVRSIDEWTFAVPGEMFRKLHSAWTEQAGFDPHEGFKK